jgi:hypothetical protein
MKNKIIIIGSLCAILALGLVFAGCDAEAQLVKLETEKLASPGNVTATVAPVGTGTYAYSLLTVTWDAVEGANGYSVVATQEGKKSIYSLGSGNPVTVSGVVSDIDKWQATFDGPYSNSSGGSNYRIPKGTWKIGVIAIPISGVISKEPSDPAWASTPVIIQ